jgi:ABC-type nickel/cobalt efflux system permease component RcnA
MAWIQTASWWSRTRHNCSSAPCTNPLSLALSLFLSSFSCLAIERCTQRRKQSGGQGRDTTAARLSVRAYIHTHTHTHKHTHTHTHMHTHTHAHTHTHTHTHGSLYEPNLLMDALTICYSFIFPLRACLRLERNLLRLFSTRDWRDQLLCAWQL